MLETRSFAMIWTHCRILEEGNGRVESRLRAEAVNAGGDFESGGFEAIEVSRRCARRVNCDSGANDKPGRVTGVGVTSGQPGGLPWTLSEAWTA